MKSKWSSLFIFITIIAVSTQSVAMKGDHCACNGPSTCGKPIAPPMNPAQIQHNQRVLGSSLVVVLLAAAGGYFLWPTNSSQPAAEGEQQAPEDDVERLIKAMDNK